MSLQTYFKEFNKVIKMDYDVKSELKEKRDILLGILRNDDDMPAFDEYNQGSYSMHLGVEPLDKEYDIDVGLRFHKKTMCDSNIQERWRSCISCGFSYLRL